MTTGSIGPGTVLAGRYRLEDLLAESGGARFWRATDTVLARSVAIHAVPSDDPRAEGLLDAARVSATVVDPHLLRVLDCDDDDGITWVVNEWGDGISLDLMLQRGPLSPSRAAWLAREVAEAIASGHAQGVAHGRLNPESVLVTHAGAVKLIGYVVDAALEDPRPPDPLYGELDEREADVINVAGILYAGCIALVQDDFKFVIGYSSVSHMGFVLLGLAAATPLALAGAVLQMVSHGIIAGLLFAVVGRMVYERTHTRLETLGLDRLQADGVLRGSLAE